MTMGRNYHRLDLRKTTRNTMSSSYETDAVATYAVQTMLLVPILLPNRLEETQPGEDKVRS